MAGFGNPSGRSGGFGSSFPSRGGAPDSQTVDYLRPQDEWQSDFDARWGAEASRARAPGFAPMQFDASQPGYYEMPGKTMPPANPNAGRFSGDPTLPPLPTHQQAPTRISIDSLTPQSGQYDPGYTPDFSALNAEKDQMTQRYDAFQRQNQAYNVMNGNGMLNGVLSDAYAGPNYGQINTAGGTGVGQDPTSGVNMDWTGVYNPQTGSGAVGQARRGWGR